MYGSNYMTFWKNESNIKKKNISGCQRLEGKADVLGKAQNIFRAVKPLCTMYK